MHPDLENLDHYDFKGYIDLIVKTKKDQVYHILDWKTCTFGWMRDKKQDKTVIAQLLLYKKFYAQKYNIPLKDIETHFGLLKRTVKKNFVEIFRVTSGAKRMSDAENELARAIIIIESGKAFKNKLSCNYCEFKKTVYCP